MDHSIGAEKKYVKHLISRAQQQAGLDDFGDTSFFVALEAFLDSALEEGRLSPSSIENLKTDTVRLLINRLQVQDALKRHPEILEEDLSDPIVIVGMPRTGTTKLQRLIASDPRFQKLLFWQAYSPAPLPGWTGVGRDRRISIAEQVIDAMRAEAPEFVAMHPMAAEKPDEDIFIQMMSFEGTASHAVMYRAPKYLQWLSRRSPRSSYQYFKQVLQYLQWQGGGRKGRPWVLKAPTHLGNLDVLAETFPKATIVHCHRQLEDLMSSNLRIAEAIRRMNGQDPIDLYELGHFFLNFWAQEWRKNLSQRTALPSSCAVLDIDFDSICDQSGAVIREIYTKHGLGIPADIEADLAAWDLGNQPRRRERTPSDFDRYGVTRSDLMTSFASYIAHFSSAETSSLKLVGK